MMKMHKTTNSFREIKTSKIIETAENLADRINERFSGAGLHEISIDLCSISKEATQRAEKINKANMKLRFITWGLIGSVVCLCLWMFTQIPALVKTPSAIEFIQAIEAGIGAVVFIGAGIIFLITLETRIKRKQVLIAIHELRSMAQIIDMHQLTKHPEVHSINAENTPSSPKRTYNTFQLNRYFNYCVELLALVSKIAYIYVDKMIDNQAIESVNQLENLTYNLSCKIWQKIELNHENFGKEK